MDYDKILKKLKAESDPSALEGMIRFGITPEKTFGTRIPVLRQIAKEAGKDHGLAQKLWKAGYRETRILASMIDEPEKVTEAQVDLWVKQFEYWEICDQCCMNLFKLLPFAYDKAKGWARSDKEYTKRAGFALIACLAWSDKEARDEQLESFFPIIKKGSTDERPIVKKAVNWALRQIGKRNRNLNKKAITLAEELMKSDSKAARWVASDALRELRSEAVQKRLKN